MEFKARTKGVEKWCSGDVRWKTAPQTSGRDRKRSVADGRQPSACVGRLETLTRRDAIVGWLQCLLVVVVRQTGTWAPDRVDIGTPGQRLCRISVQEP